MLQRVSTSAGKKAFLKTTLLRRIATAYRTGRATVDPPQPISDRPSYKTKDGAIFSPRRKPPRVQSQREQVDRKRQWTMQGGKALPPISYQTKAGKERAGLWLLSPS